MLLGWKMAAENSGSVRRISNPTLPGLKTSIFPDRIIIDVHPNQKDPIIFKILRSRYAF